MTHEEFTEALGNFTLDVDVKQQFGSGNVFQIRVTLRDTLSNKTVLEGCDDISIEQN